MRDVVLLVNQVEYRGWKDITVTRSIEALSGSFRMSVSERFAEQSQPWPIREGDECTVKLGKDVLITGYVDARSLSINAGGHAFTVAGRDKAADLIDCSAVLDDWEFTGVGVLEICQRVARPFGIDVMLGAGVTAPPAPAKIVINPGDSAYDVIERACRLAGLFAISDGAGNVVLTKAGTAMTPTPLALPGNVLSGTASYDASAAYRRYIVIGQQQGTDITNGDAAADVRAEATDMGTLRDTRVLMIKAEGTVSIQQAQDRAKWEASVRRARALELSVTVQGWEQKGGALWPLNALVEVSADVLGVKGSMLISEVSYSLSEGGTVTEMTLRDKNAFLPQPIVPESDAVTERID